MKKRERKNTLFRGSSRVLQRKTAGTGKRTDSLTDCFQLSVAETDRQTGRDGSRDNDDGV